MVARLGVLRVDEVTREILGEVIQKIKASGLGVSTIEHVRMPLRGFYRDLVERKVLTVNPAENLRFFTGRMRRGKRVAFFTAEEATKLIAPEERQRGHRKEAAAPRTSSAAV